MAWRCSGKDQKEMNAKMKQNHVIRTDPVEFAFDLVRKALFLPLVDGQPVPDGEDRPIRIGKIHISAPHMYATVLEALQILPGQSVLTVGSGSGYFCTLCAAILGPTGLCHGVELLPDVVQHATSSVAKFLAEHKKERNNQPEVCQSYFVCGDGFDLSETHNMLYDRIYVAAGADEDDVSFFRKFLAPGGVLVGPFGDALLKITRRSDTDFSSQVVARVSFTPLIRPSGERANRPRVLLPVPLWSPFISFRFPSCFNTTAASLLVLQRRPFATGGVISVLPIPLIHHVLSFCSRDWFKPELPLVERLAQQLKEEIKAREEAEKRVVELQHERDEAMMMCMYLRAQLRNAFPVTMAGFGEDDEEDEEKGTTATPTAQATSAAQPAQAAHTAQATPHVVAQPAQRRVVVAQRAVRPPAIHPTAAPTQPTALPTPPTSPTTIHTGPTQTTQQTDTSSQQTSHQGGPTTSPNKGE